jgi:hypothetical protein
LSNFIVKALLTISLARMGYELSIPIAGCHHLQLTGIHLLLQKGFAIPREANLSCKRTLLGGEGDLLHPHALTAYHPGNLPGHRPGVLPGVCHITTMRCRWEAPILAFPWLEGCCPFSRIPALRLPDFIFLLDMIEHMFYNISRHGPLLAAFFQNFNIQFSIAMIGAGVIRFATYPLQGISSRCSSGLSSG